MDSVQLRDDLLSMLVAGHETTGSALTWTLYLLAQVRVPARLPGQRVRREVQEWAGDCARARLLAGWPRCARLRAGYQGRGFASKEQEWAGD